MTNELAWPQVLFLDPDAARLRTSLTLWVPHLSPNTSLYGYHYSFRYKHRRTHADAWTQIGAGAVLVGSGMFSTCSARGSATIAKLGKTD